MNFSFAPVFNNTIFTRAFTVYTEWDDAPSAAVAAARREMIVKAFGSAVLYWTAALHDARKDLAGPVAAYVDSIISRGSNLQLLSPPQAVPATCPDFATIHVRWLTKGEKLFPIPNDYIAMAQVEGRTVVLNARDFAFTWSLDPKAIPPGQTNLIHVLVHEFGHCLGLDHALPAETSVMADALDRLPLMPTPRDAAFLVRILGAHVQGAPAGEFDATSCTGLRAKGKT